MANLDTDIDDITTKDAGFASKAFAYATNAALGVFTGFGVVGYTALNDPVLQTILFPICAVAIGGNFLVSKWNGKDANLPVVKSLGTNLAALGVGVALFAGAAFAHNDLEVSIAPEEAVVTTQLQSLKQDNPLYAIG